MRYSLAMAALAAPIVIAAPTKRQDSNIDTTVLQFALTLEHLENVFYKEALQKFSADDFAKAGYGANYYNNLKYISADEASHVQFLSAALVAAGQTPTGECTYNFPYTDVQSFITLSSILEGVGTSAYLGGAPLITSKDYLTAAGSILVTEALHTSLQRNAVNEIPFASPYGTPLDPTSVYTLASAFIKQCPPSNPTLPFTPYPALTLSTTAGTCEQVDCSPQTFQKRDWTSAPAPAPKPVDDKPSSCDGKPYPPKPEGDKPYGDKPYPPKPEGDKPYPPKPEGDEKPYPPKPEGDDKPYPPKPEGDKPYGDKPEGDKPYAPQPYDDNKPSDVSKDSQWSGYGNGNDGKPAPPKSTKNVPALTAGTSATFTAADNIPAGSFLTFVSGLTVVSVPAQVNGKTAVANIPAEAMGQTYVFVTKTAAAGNKLDGASVLFGPAILEVKPAPPSY